MPTLTSRCCSESRTLLQPHLGTPISLWVCVDHVSNAICSGSGARLVPLRHLGI